MTKTVYIVTAPEQVVRIFLRGHLRFLTDRGFSITLISPPGAELEDAKRRERVDGRGVPIERDISPLADLVALFRLTAALRGIRPHIVTAGTPKAGLLGILAARLAGVPIRVYHLRALRLETTSGWKRRVLAACERVAARLSTRIVSISPSLADRYVALGLAPREKIVVFGHGSSNGIDAERFAPNDARRQAASDLRRQLGFSNDDTVIGFVGRIIPDKGVVQLLDAFVGVLSTAPHARLLLVGHHETHHPFEPGFARRLESSPRVTLVDYQDDPSPYYHAMDIFAFPSLREGFGNVALEANANGLPVVGFRATGVVDAVEDGVTGTLVPLGDTAALEAALLSYVREPELRRAHGDAGIERARRDFDPRTIWSAFASEYRRLVDAHGLSSRS